MTVKAGARAADAAAILRKHGGYDLQNRAAGGGIPTSGVFSQP